MLRRPACFLVTVAVLGAMAVARQQEAPARDPGLYVVQADASLTRLVPQVVDVAMKGMGTSMITMGFTRPSAEARLFGARAEARLPPGKTTFHLQLNPPISAGTPTAFAMMQGGDMPLQVRRPNDIALVRLAVAEESTERIADLGRVGGTSPRNKVDVNVARIDDRAFRLETKAALGAGEYAFTILPVTGGSGVGSEFWAFGVDP